MEYIKAKQIIYPVKFNGNMWFGIDFNMNLYKGCHHGCIYCDSRSGRYYIEDFDRVRIKENCLALLERDLRKTKRYGVIGIGAMSDSYNHFEKKYKITRGALKLINTFGQGISLETKSNLVCRDIDILKEISKNNSCVIKFTITTYDDNLCRIIEPHTSTSTERFEAIRTLSKNGIFAGILLTPVLPFLTDDEYNIRRIVALANEYNAKFIFSMFGMTLRDGQKKYYFNKLEKHFPEVLKKYQKYYHNEYVFNARNVEHLQSIFYQECEKYNILYKMEDIIQAYKRDMNPQQLSLF